ncbi:paraquat-inducible protein A [Granulosicoccus antarcticus]|uniref:Paraquat-inducible protein A n=1 Tax=Granulosicoccus antarcticus IMCC3135 TaxID=1192854 RepID=A0A2Z2NUN6_9GAMM|nr:paraquat-inducible protein A [Granulosicoccus antarcticus]ASJ71377.1 Paraquat-inducible protein A [Granulosicoccus antarcticus IMCC3135]
MGSTHIQGLSARDAGLKACTSCGALQAIIDDTLCRRCGASVHSRRSNSLQRVWAFLLVGVMAYIPANIYPIMLTRSFTGNTSDTILSGVMVLIDDDSYGVALIIFIASICIPVIKFVVIAGLALNLHYDWDISKHTQHRLHTLTEFIGRWSMIDVFVVAVLAALIQLGAIISIVPGVGINAFALSVVFTMLAASSLDPRLLWDHSEK